MSSNDGNNPGINEGSLHGERGSSESEYAGVVADRNEGDIGDRHVRGERTISMGEFARKNGEAFNILGEKIEEMGNVFLEYVTGPSIKGTWRYLSDVVRYDSDDNLQRLLEILRNYGETRGNGMFGYSVEADHIHVIHDCAFSGGHCRDVWRRQVEPFGVIGPTRRENKAIWKFTRADWYDVFAYFILKKRGTREIWVRGKSWTPPNHDQLVRWEKELNAWGQVVRSQDSGDYNVGEYARNSNESGATNQRFIDGVHEQKSYRAGKFAIIRAQTKTLLRKYYVSPISAIKDISEFRTYDILNDPKNKDYIQAAFDDFGRDLNEFYLKDYYNLLTDPANNPIFNISTEYANIEESTGMINDLLKYQFNDDSDQITKFLMTLVDVLDKRIPKLNTLSVLAPPSSGKNFFFDMVLCIIQNYGQLGCANKFNNFAFQEAPNKRVLLWNEPNYERALTDTIKMMLGGDPYTVRVKHSADTHVRRTPVIVLTNNVVPFLTDPSFADRIAKYVWKAAPQLKDIDVKPYPMCFFEILMKYNIPF